MPAAGARQSDIEGATQPVIYTVSSVDVSPPVAIYPQFPTELPPDVRPEDLEAFEVVVSETGTVESVRTQKPPRTMSDTLVVTISMSAAKTWRFHPALKAGQPVKYRKVVWVLSR